MIVARVVTARDRWSRAEAFSMFKPEEQWRQVDQLVKAAETP